MQRMARTATITNMTMKRMLPSFPELPILSSSAASWSMDLPAVSFTNMTVQMKPRANGTMSTSTTIDQLVAPVAVWNSAMPAMPPSTMEEAEPPKRANAWHQDVPVLRIAVG